MVVLYHIRLQADHIRLQAVVVLVVLEAGGKMIISNPHHPHPNPNPIPNPNPNPNQVDLLSRACRPGASTAEYSGRAGVLRHWV